MVLSFSNGSLIVDFTIRFKNTLNVELKVLEQEYLALLNGSILNSTATLILTGKSCFLVIVICNASLYLHSIESHVLFIRNMAIRSMRLKLDKMIKQQLKKMFLQENF